MAHGAALISFSKALSQTPVFTLRDHGYGASVPRGVPVYISAVKPVPNCTAWWQRHMCVNNLPKVVTWQRPGAESNLRPWVTSGFQVRHVTVRLPRHALLLLLDKRNIFKQIWVQLKCKKTVCQHLITVLMTRFVDDIVKYKQTVSIHCHLTSFSTMFIVRPRNAEVPLI